MDWLFARVAWVRKLRDVANILGIVWSGIYHIDTNDLRKVEWTNDRFMSLRIYGELATWDFSQLTHLVVLCHDHCVRLSISGRAKNYLELMFHRRQRDGGVAQRHPTMEEAILRIRGKK